MTLADYIRRRKLTYGAAADELGGKPVWYSEKVRRHVRLDRFPTAVEQEAYRSWTGGKVTPADWHRQRLANETQDAA